MEYTTYQCLQCDRQIILVTNELSKRGFIRCPHCSSKKVKKTKETDSLKECMGHASYRKEHGVMRQVRT